MDFSSMHATAVAEVYIAAAAPFRHDDVSFILDQLNDGLTKHTLIIQSRDNPSVQTTYCVTWNKDGSLSVAYPSSVQTITTLLRDFFTQDQSELTQLSNALNLKLVEQNRAVVVDHPNSYLGSWNRYRHDQLMRLETQGGAWKDFAEIYPGLLKGELPQDPRRLASLLSLALEEHEVWPIDLKRKELVRDALPKLELFNFHGKCVGEAFEVLKKNTSIKKLDVNVENIPKNARNALAEVIRTNTTITSLTLEFGKLRFSEEEMNSSFQLLVSALQENRTIVTLCLCNCDLDKKSSELFTTYLEQNKNLESLTLRFFYLKLPEITALAASLTTHPGLKHLSLESFLFYDIQYEKSVFIALATNPRLQSYSYSGHFDESCMKKLCDVLEHNTTLKSLTLANSLAFRALSFDQTNRLLTAIEGSASLEVVVLNLFDGRGLGEQIARLIANNKHLRVLHLISRNLHDNDVEKIAAALKGQVTLEELSLGSFDDRCSVGESGLVKLADGLKENNHLKMLDLGFGGSYQLGKPLPFTAPVSNAFKEVLKKNLTLQSLAKFGVEDPALNACFRRNASFKHFSATQIVNPALFQKMVEVACCLAGYFPAELVGKIFKAMIWRAYVEARPGE